MEWDGRGGSEWWKWRGLMREDEGGGAYLSSEGPEEVISTEELGAR